MLSLQQLLRAMHQRGGSDLHITRDAAPQVRLDGKLSPMKVPALSAEETRRLCYAVLNDRQKHTFEKTKELDFSFSLQDIARFRGNLFMQKGAVAGVFRTIPHKILTFDELGLPPVIAKMADRPNGLVLVTGPTGSGKSTTLASIIDRINSTRHDHIVTIEDPIEYVHPHKKCLVNQREVGADTEGFHHALRAVLRQDPDVVLVGELRDLETIEAAITLAETGHLCFATLHTNSAVQTINRVIDVFSPHQQAQVRATFSLVLEGVISQQLIPKINGGRAMALEVMVPNAAIRNLIREDKVHQIYSQMQVGQQHHGMVTLNQSLIALLKRREIAPAQAMQRCTDIDEFTQLCNNHGVSLRS